MSTLDATVSMLEAMPEDARIKVMEFTQKLFTSRKPANPFVPVSQEHILSDLTESRQQISEGKGLERCTPHGSVIISPKALSQLIFLPTYTLHGSVWQDAIETRNQKIGWQPEILLTLS